MAVIINIAALLCATVYPIEVYVVVNTPEALTVSRV